MKLKRTTQMQAFDNYVDYLIMNALERLSIDLKQATSTL